MYTKLKIEDAVYDQYVARYGDSPKLFMALKNAIEAFCDVPDGERVLMLFGTPRREVEAVFQTTLDSGEKLVRLVKNMNSVKIQGVEVNFTDDELRRLAMQASFHGRTTETFIKEMIVEIKDKMLEMA